jgi:tRNA G46 methylase TrmB
MDWSTHFPHFVMEDVEHPPSDSASGSIEAKESDHNTASANAPRRLRKDIEIVDIGCGFGGLLVALGPQMPETLILGTFSTHPKSSLTTG